MTHKIQIDDLVREATSDEVALIEAQRSELLAQAAELEKQANARTSALAKLSDLGLSDAEIAAIVG